MAVLTDPLADMLTRIRNGQMRGKLKVIVPFSKIKEAVLSVLLGEGFLKFYRVLNSPSGRRDLEVFLKYHEGRPVIREISRCSKPCRRVYASVDSIPTVKGGLGVAVLSTSRGIMSGLSAFEACVGGEVLCSVF